MTMYYADLMEAVKTARSRKEKPIDWDKFFRNMDRRKAKEKKAAGAAAVQQRKPFGWDQRGSYWWHPTKDVIRMSEFHVKKVVQSPEIFGVTKAQVDKAILEYSKRSYEEYRTARGEEAKRIIDSIREDVLALRIDVIHEVLALAFAKDWCRVGIQSSIITMAGRKRAIVKALEEYRQSGSMQGNEFGIDIMKDDGSEITKTMVRSTGQIDGLINSLR